jgi:hypothetical protein
MKHPLTEPFRFALLNNCHGCEPETPDVFRLLVRGCVSDQMLGSEMLRVVYRVDEDTRCSSFGFDA